MYRSTPSGIVALINTPKWNTHILAASPTIETFNLTCHIEYLHYYTCIMQAYFEKNHDEVSQTYSL